MIKYIKPYKITPEMERTIKRNAKHDAEEQRKDPKKIYWYLDRMIKADK